MKKFIENVIGNKTMECQKTYSPSFRFNKMIDEIKGLGLPKDKVGEVLRVIEKYQR